MCDTLGGFSVNHTTGRYLYPISLPENKNMYGIDATAWLLENLNFIPYKKSKKKYEGKGNEETFLKKRKFTNKKMIVKDVVAKPDVWGKELLKFVPAMFRKISSTVRKDMLDDKT
jgi:hypothetical protein